jgi:uncharacterized protein YyaL (SSP411 family)
MNVRQPEARRLIIVTHDAATATPRIIETLRRQGIEVAKLEEYQPSFDEVFTSLVEQRRARTDPVRPATDLTTSADPRADALADAARSAELDRADADAARARAGVDADRGPGA